MRRSRRTKVQCKFLVDDHNPACARVARYRLNRRTDTYHREWESKLFIFDDAESVLNSLVSEKKIPRCFLFAFAHQFRFEWLAVYGILQTLDALGGIEKVPQSFCVLPVELEDKTMAFLCFSFVVGLQRYRSSSTFRTCVAEA